MGSLKDDDDVCMHVYMHFSHFSMFPNVWRPFIFIHTSCLSHIVLKCLVPTTLNVLLHKGERSMLLNQPFQFFLYVCLTTDTYYLLSLSYYSTSNSWILAVHFNYAKFMKTQSNLHCMHKLIYTHSQTNETCTLERINTLHLQVKYIAPRERLINLK